MARIALVRQGYFPGDPRVEREVETLRSAGHSVDVLCLRLPDQRRYERDGLVTVLRLPPARRRASVARGILEYGAFFCLAGLLLTLRHLRRRYELIQVNTIPDTLVFAAAVPRILGVPVLLDLHECMPEFFDTKFRTGPDHRFVRLVARLEQMSIRFASSAITCTAQMRDAFVARGACSERIGVVLNGSDETIFAPERYPPHVRDPDRFVLISHGTIEERYGLDTTIRALALLRNEIPGLSLRIYGMGSFLEEVQRLARELGVDDRVEFGGFVPHDELVTAIASADAGVVAMKRDSFRDLTLCNKMYDFITMRKPAIVSRTRSVEDYFDEDCFLMFESDDEHDLARAIRQLHGDPLLGQRLVARAAEINAPYRWPVQSRLYLDVVDRLLESASDSRAGGRRQPGQGADS